MNKAEILALADRVEKLDGPDRVCDGDIWAWLKGDDPYIIGNKPGRFPQEPVMGTRADVMREIRTKDGADYIGAPEFTASLDAAMTLAPWDWLNGQAFSFALEHDFGGPRGWEARFDQIFDGGGTILAHGATPALALVAAALYSHADAGGDHG